MGRIGLNPDLMLDRMPVVGKSIPSHLVIFHQGSLPVALSIVTLLPNTESAIVISTNALALNDVLGWVGQFVLEEFLSILQLERNDFISAAENLKWYCVLIQELEQAQKNGTSPTNQENYIETYWDDIHVFKILVTLEGGELY